MSIKCENRNYGLDMIRLISMIMLATFHFINYYASSYVDPNSVGNKAYVIQNLGWGGGRMICNLFLFISAWFLTDKKFKIERLLKVWFTVFVYSLIVGILFYIRIKDKVFLIRHLFPISTNLVWYATIYMGIIMISPMLNKLLDENNREVTMKVVVAFFIILSVVPTFCPKYARFSSVITWYALAYLIIGLMKAYRIKINKIKALCIFLVGWISCLWFFNNYLELEMNSVMARLFEVFGFYRDVYFVDLATLPPFLSALGLFYYFKSGNHKRLIPLGPILRFISMASLDVYCVSSLESPNIKLAWVELLIPGFTPTGIIQCYVMILLGLILGILLGNFREFMWKKFTKVTYISKLFSAIDRKVGGIDICEQVSER